MTVDVTDSGCSNFPLQGAKVGLSSKTVAGSGGHAHLGEQEGTGQFMVGSTETKTIMDMLTDRDGKVEVKYIAGVVGLEEQIEAKATFNNIDDMEERKANLTIAIQATGIILSPLPDSPNQDYVQKQTPTGEDRHPVNNYGTADVVFDQIPLLAQFYRVARKKDGYTGVLSINDLSLPFGGVFDLNKQLNDAGGHVSHEIGIDVDINTSDSSEVPVDLQVLNRLACLLDGRKIREPTIHYRFDGCVP